MRKRILRTIYLFAAIAVIFVFFYHQNNRTLQAAVYTNQSGTQNSTAGYLIGDIEEYRSTKEYLRGDVVQSNGELFMCNKDRSYGIELSDKETWKKTSILGLIKNLSLNFNNVMTTINHIDATAGAGCYYSCFTTKPYLNGYKIRLTDQTTAKSCTVLYNQDSNYYEGAVAVPLNDEIDVELWYEGKLQGSMHTNCTTASGYATINLDALIDANFSELIKYNDHLVRSMCCDSHFTQNRDLFPEIIDLVFQNDQFLSECLNSINGMSVEEQTFEELFENPETLIRILHHDFADMFLSNEKLSNHIANHRELLDAISKDPIALEKVEASDQMHEALRQSALIKTQTMVGGEEQSVSGNLILISLESGTLGNYYDYGTRRYTGTYETAAMLNCKGYISQRPNCYYTINDTEIKCVTELVQTGYSATYSYGLKNFYTSENESSTSANMLIAPYRFVQAVRIESMTPKTLTDVRGYWDNTDTRTACDPTASSKIIYIDLDETES
ncbi:MAG: hypothetical protein PUD20_01830 [bacterium]|nr:hypothetical protein [bacterium]